jgi:hypothetical protein
MKKIYLMVFTLFGAMIQPCFSESYKVDGMTSEEILNEAHANYRSYYDHMLNESDRINRRDLVTLFQHEDPRAQPDNKKREHEGFDDKEFYEYHQILLNIHEECHQEYKHLEHHIERLQKMHHDNDTNVSYMEDHKNLAAARAYYKLCENNAQHELHVLF